MKQSYLKKLLSLMVVLLVSIAIHAQTIEVSGTIVDISGEPIIGASVLEKGTSKGSITDFDGKFKFNGRKGATIVITYVGYETQELHADHNMKITLKEDNKVIDEVVVVGYGVQKKSALTGAISKVESKDLQNRTVLSAEQALAGKTSGVQLVSTSGAPGSVSSVRIRGYSSNYTSDPLYIVDGMKVPDMSSIDPNDIASVEVLKDAASAAIYGAEAGNGVILITTKKAEAGKGKITYDFQYSSQSIARIPSILNAKEYLQYQKEANVISDQMAATYYDGITDTDWFDSSFEKSSMMKHSIAFQNAGKASNVYVSLNMQTNNGIVIGDRDKSKRFGVDISADTQVKPWLKLGINANGMYSIIDGIRAAGNMGGVISSALRMDPTVKPVYTKDNLPLWMASDLANGNTLLGPSDDEYYGYSYFFRGYDTNPLILRDFLTTHSRGSFIRSMGYVNITPFKGFVFTSRIGANLISNYNRQFQKAYYVSANVRQDTPAVSVSSPFMTSLLFENFANYNTTIGKLHSLGLMAGMSYSDNRSNTLTGGVNNLNANTENFAYLDFKTADATQTTSGIENNTRKLSYFGRINYNFAERYYAELTMRADAADLSYISKKTRWGYFPAVSAGWVPSNESWFPKQGIVEFLKIRGSWGQNGSLSNLGNYAYVSTIQSNASYPIDNIGYTTSNKPSSLGNDNLKWETSEQLDLGVDLRFLRNRLTMSADYYVKKTKDLIITGVTPSFTAGNTPAPINAGNVENKGFEFDFSWRDQIGGFSYGVSANFATLKNKVTYLDPSIMRIDGTEVNRIAGFTAFEEGYPLWYFRGYRFDKIDEATGEPLFKDLDGNGIFNSDDREMIGSAIPDVTFGVTLTAAYKNFDLLVFGSGALGQDILANYTSVQDQGANHLKMYYDDRWTSTNTKASKPKPGATGEAYFLNSDANVYDGSYFKFKQIQLGYTLPKRLLQKTRVINALRIYCSLDDFFLITNYPGMDPETASGNATTSNGIDSGQYPLSKRVTLGLNVTF